MPFTQQQKDAIDNLLADGEGHIALYLEARDAIRGAMRPEIDTTLEAADVTDIIAACKAKAKAAADALSALFA